MSAPTPLAHSANTAGRTHDLGAHLSGVADLASAFAGVFGSETYARCAGLWHDLGKNAPDFQARLAAAADANVEDDRVPGRVDHSSAGAVHALETLGRGPGLPLAFVIAGHHAGLADRADLDARLSDPAKKQRLAAARSHPAAVIPAATPPALPPFLAGRKSTPENCRRYEFWVRMLFSCLVDADWLDTEEHFEPGRAELRRRSRDAIPALLGKFGAKMSKFGSATGTVNEVRRRVLADCRREGRDRPQGVFTLTAPTGCGKTLAGMGFALEHARARGLERVVVVIPYTSIIDQNAAVYREVFGPDNVIDHHASLDPVTETARNRLATENWDAPVVVTTSVQFVETLFANRTAKCRKLHSVANSVVIFDEVQTLPIGHLVPILDALKELVANYRVSLVLSTATQPALKHRRSGLSRVFPGFEAVTEIVSDVPATFAALRRVDVHWPDDLTTPVEWRRLAQELAERDEVLAVVHRRDDARDLVRELDRKESGTIHLSALMCPAHRLKVIGDVKRRLDDNRTRRAAGKPVEPVRVVSTQLIEAGVDLDFPVVYRAAGGLDSIAQAAGRCNREGKLVGRPGEVRIFVAPTDPPRGTPRDGLAVTREMLAAAPGLDALDPAVFEPYFRRLYYTQPPDPAGIQRLREDWRFKTVAETFRMIEDDGSEPVVVPYGDAEARLAALRNYGPNRDRLRALQTFVVTLYPAQLKTLEDAGAIEEVADTVRTIRCPAYRHLYSDRFGLVLDGPVLPDPSSLVVSGGGVA